MGLLGGVCFLASTSLALMGSTLTAAAKPEPEWLDALRESIFKTISPSPSANNELYKSFLEASFYGLGAGQPNEPNLARGDVYYSTTKARWILCQDGCADCAECLLQSKPSLKWTLRRRRRRAFNSSARHELQLTVVPQLDDSFHMGNLRRRSHVYLTVLPQPLQSLQAARKRAGIKRSAECAAPQRLTRERRKRLLRVSTELDSRPKQQRVSSNSDNESSAADLADGSPVARATTSRDPRRMSGRESVVEPAVSRLASETTKTPRRNRKPAETSQPSRKKKAKRKAIESANPIEDNRLKGTGAPGFAGFKIEAEELPSSSNSDTRAEMEREIASSAERSSIRKRRF